MHDAGHTEVPHERQGLLPEQQSGFGEARKDWEGVGGFALYVHSVPIIDEAALVPQLSPCGFLFEDATAASQCRLLRCRS